MPTALGTRFDGEILITDRRAGAVWRLLFPAIDPDGDPAGRWLSAKEAMFDMIIAARHDRIGWAQERLDLIDASRSWRLLEWLGPVRSLYRRVEKSLLRLADRLGERIVGASCCADRAKRSGTKVSPTLAERRP